MAVVMGFGFGLLYLYTGNIVAPVVAHFTINYFNLMHIARSSARTQISLETEDGGDKGAADEVGDADGPGDEDDENDEEGPWNS